MALLQARVPQNVPLNPKPQNIPSNPGLGVLEFCTFHSALRDDTLSGDSQGEQDGLLTLRVA